MLGENIQTLLEGQTERRLSLDKMRKWDAKRAKLDIKDPHFIVRATHDP